ncbi:MAG TPA: Gfo/Idh/MocA family oxidoreductase [Verrucomicrobiae bacterium]|nr:Gfo/Idh/MocA family oxidoreductase [Verrucomicrobiae bacterium]
MRNPNFSASASISRRRFIYLSALAAGATALPGCLAGSQRRLAANDKLNIGAIGIGGKGGSDVEMCSSENIVALCDVDENHSAGVRRKYPQAKFYRDYRKMLEAEKSLDAVIIATPDHTHAVIATMAMQSGKNVYCQKPLTQTIYEARALRQLAGSTKVITQMGNQGSADDGLRRAVEVIQAGIIGPVREVYVWSSRPVWMQGVDRPPGADAIPSTLDWDGWIGTAPMRPYKRGVYHPFNWRGWLDFGTGALGDMACHTVNMPFRALKLGYPVEVEAQLPLTNSETYPLKSRIRFQFPAREGLPPLTFWWYDGGNLLPDPHPWHIQDCSNKPPREVTADVEGLLEKVPDSGCLLIGDKGKIFAPDDYGTRFFLKLSDEKEFTNGKDHEAVKAIPHTIVLNPFQGDNDLRHHQEWIAACKGGRPGYSNFDVAAYLTEIILLGCVALRVGKKLEWDGPNMRATNAPEAAQYIHREYRKGWEL